MRSPSNPSSDSLTSWAYDAAVGEPVQDWDLILSKISREDLYLTFASDRECPKADYFLRLLYLIVGDAVRTAYQTKRKDEIESILAVAESRFPRRWIYEWIQRSRALMKDPSTFDYNDWCAGQLVGGKKEAEPGATDNPEDAQRLREDH